MGNTKTRKQGKGNILSNVPKSTKRTPDRFETDSTVQHAAMNSRVMEAILLLVIMGCMIVGLTTFAASFIPFEMAKSRIDTLSKDGSVDFFTPDFFYRLTLKVRLMSMGCIAAGVLLIVWRRCIRKFGTILMKSLDELAGQLKKHIVTILEHEERSHLASLAIVFVIAIGIRLLFMYIPMRYDEAYTFTTFASKPLFVALSDYSAPNNHLFHTLLVHIAYLVFGDEPWAIRLPALLAGIALIPVSYLVIRELYDKNAALLASGMVASAPLLIEYSTSARGYTLLCLIFLVCLALARYLKHHNSTGAWFLLAVCAALGFYTIPIMLYAFGTLVMWLSLSVMIDTRDGSRRAFLKNLFLWGTVAAILTVVLYLPVFVASGFSSVTGNGNVTPRAWSDFIHRLPGALTSLWHHWRAGIPSILAWLLLGGFAVSVLCHRHLSKDRLPVYVGVLLWCLPLLIAQRLIPYDRVWMFLFPLYLGTASAGLLYLLKPFNARYRNVLPACTVSITLAWSVGLCATTLQTQSVYYSNEQGALREAPQIVRLAKNHLQVTDCLLSVSPSFSPIWYYAAKEGLDRQILLWTPKKADKVTRLFLVVNKPWYSLQELLESEEKVPIELFTPPQLIKEYEFAAVYEMVRKPGRPTALLRE